MPTVIQALASKILARENCARDCDEKPHLAEWIQKHQDAADEIARDYLPRGSGFDSGTLIDWARSRPERVVLLVGFHRMDEHGMYSGWCEYTVTVRASLVFGIDLRVTGPNADGLRDYVAECVRDALTREIQA